MKIKTISRTEEDYVRKSKIDITKVHRNRDPKLHPFERAREYTKAVVATKLDKIFAKPFIGALDGHSDGVYCCSSVRNKIVPFISGACDGEIRVWDLSRRVCSWSVVGHSGFVRGLAPDVQGNTFYSCGDDKMIKQWELNNQSSDPIEPINSVLAPHALTSIDHHWSDNQFATSGDAVCVWDSQRSEPLHSYKWGADSVLSVRFNPAEACLLASTGTDRSICLYDLRSSLPMRKFMLSMKSNMVQWNPMEPFHFILACEDYNIYQFDMRNLDRALMIHKDHISAVMSVAFSPTGREFASGSYDKTIRIYNTNEGRSKELYHTKRMQKIFSISYSSDSKFILSGSDDTNIRLWKANASESLEVQTGRKNRKQLYHDALKRRFDHMPEIRKIARDKHIPKLVKKTRKITQIQKESQHRKQENRRKHNRSEMDSAEPERKRAVIREFE